MKILLRYYKHHKQLSNIFCKLVNQTENFTYNSVSKDALLLHQLFELVILFLLSLSPCLPPDLFCAHVPRWHLPDVSLGLSCLFPEIGQWSRRRWEEREVGGFSSLSHLLQHYISGMNVSLLNYSSFWRDLLPWIPMSLDYGLTISFSCPFQLGLVTASCCCSFWGAWAPSFVSSPSVKVSWASWVGFGSLPEDWLLQYLIYHDSH